MFSAGTHQSCHEGTSMAQDFLVSQKGSKKLSHSSFCPGPDGWCLKMEHARGCFERRLGYGALSLGTGRERQ